jgi:hypothetical protein
VDWNVRYGDLGECRAPNIVHEVGFPSRQWVSNNVDQGHQISFLKSEHRERDPVILAWKMHNLGWEPTLHLRHLVFGTTNRGDLTFAHIGMEARNISERIHDGPDNREVKLCRVNEHHRVISIQRHSMSDGWCPKRRQHTY